MINNLPKSTLVVVHCALITVSIPNKDISQNKKVNSRLSEIMYYHGDSYVVVHYDNNTATFVLIKNLPHSIPNWILLFYFPAKLGITSLYILISKNQTLQILYLKHHAYYYYYYYY